MTWPLTMTGLTRAGAISKPYDYKQTVQNMKCPLKKWNLRGKHFEDFRQKNSKISLLPWRTKQKNHKTLKEKTEHEPCSQEEINWSKVKKSIRIKLFELCKTRTKKSSPDVFNFMSTRLVMTWPMTLAGRPRAGAVSKPHDYKQNVQKMKNLLEKWASTGNCLKFSNQKTRKSSHRMENKTNQPQDTEGKNWTWTLLPGWN